VYCGGGGIIRIQYTSDEANLKQEDY
jgi:hypothetical protein